MRMTLFTPTHTKIPVPDDLCLISFWVLLKRLLVTAKRSMRKKLFPVTTLSVRRSLFKMYNSIHSCLVHSSLLTLSKFAFSANFQGAKLPYCAGKPLGTIRSPMYKSCIK